MHWVNAFDGLCLENQRILDEQIDSLRADQLSVIPNWHGSLGLVRDAIRLELQLTRSYVDAFIHAGSQFVMNTETHPNHSFGKFVELSWHC